MTRSLATQRNNAEIDTRVRTLESQVSLLQWACGSTSGVVLGAAIGAWMIFSGELAQLYPNRCNGRSNANGVDAEADPKLPVLKPVSANRSQANEQVAGVAGVIAAGSLIFAPPVLPERLAKPAAGPANVLSVVINNADAARPKPSNPHGASL